MRKGKALKSAFFAASALFIVSIPTSLAFAKVEEGVAGMSKSLDQLGGETEDYITQIYNTEILSPLDDKGVADVKNYVNIRSKPSTDSEIVGKLYRGCAADILERLEGDWVRIKSGDVDGYIAANYLVTGKAAEKMADEFATKYATVIDTATLRVRAEPNTDEQTKTLELIPRGATYIVLKEYDEWAEILISSDDSGNDFTGYVSKQYVRIDIEFKEAISIEEEQRIIRAQEEAVRAEAERQRKLAEEVAKRKAQEEAERKAALAAKEQKKETVTKPTTVDTGSLADLRSEIVTYAKKFVGYPYRWGGTSLTKGADCSGFVQTIFKDFGYTIPRPSYDQAVGAGIKVDIDDRKPGDLIFYTDSRGVVNHVAMYIGNDQIVHAASRRQGIIISKYNYRKVYRVRRVVY